MLTAEALQKAVAANNRAPGSVSQLELDRLRLMAELARLQMAKQKAAAKARAEVAGLQQRMVQLENDVRAMQDQLAQLLKRSPAEKADKQVKSNATRGR
jgi:hypothetical protein